jgi:lipoate-protein ligase A
MAWRLILDPAGRPGAENMALDQALLEEADRSGGAFLRLYRWNPPCLSFGRNEPAATRYDRVAIERRGLDVVRRPTGGRAVWHEHEVTYAIAAPAVASGSLRETYCAIHARLAAGLRRLGVEAVLAPDRPSGRLSDGPTSCFAAAAGGEILVNGRKVVGSAQVRHGHAFLQHGSILIDGTQNVIRAVSRQRSSTSGETSLAAALGRPVSFNEVAGAIIEAWGRPEPLSDRPSVRPSVYTDAAWTWRR